MAVTVSKAGPYYTGSSSISFSSLRSNFRAQVKRTSSGESESFNSDTSSISASDLLRTTRNTNTNPVVPNATENANIVTSRSDWSASHFRDSIKFYYVILPSGDTVENFDIDSQSWNSNLSKNVNKVAFIDGTCGSNDVTSPAATFNATSYNFTIKVDGNILGAGGRGGGQTGAPAISGENGGDALSVSTTGNNVVVDVTSNGKIYGGGGGGEKGKTGANGTAGLCRETTRVQSGCQQGNTTNCPGGWNQYSSGNWCCEWRRGCNANIWWKDCERYYSTAAGLGGAGGNGGPGRGYNYQSGSLAGAGGSDGTSGGGCDSTSGETGETGGSGGDWATDGTGTDNSGSGGSPGRAIYGSNYSVTGTINSSTVKGAYNP